MAIALEDAKLLVLELVLEVVVPIVREDVVVHALDVRDVLVVADLLKELLDL